MCDNEKYGLVIPDGKLRQNIKQDLNNYVVVYGVP